ncbi:hypothetical protein ACHQM5_006396 [Ranunculus cassubicifolius]
MRYLSKFHPIPITQSKAYFHSKSSKLNTLLKEALKSKSTTKTLQLFQSIQNKRASSVDSFSLNFVLKACTMRSSQLEGKQIHALIINLGFNSVIFLQTTLINLYSVSGNLQDAHQVFDEISTRNVICWTALISAYADNGRANEALKLFKVMQMENFEPDQVTVTVALSACASVGSLEIGEKIHEYVQGKQAFEADLCLNNSLINMYVKCGDLSSARKVFDKLTQRDVTTWTSMIVGYALHGEADESLRLFAEMSRNCAILPNEITFIGVIMACSHAGMVDEGWQHFKSMRKKYNVRPKISHYGCMVDLLCRAGQLKEAYTFILNMPIQPNAVIWRTLLGACSHQGSTELGKMARERLIELEPTYVGDDVAMSNTFAYAGMWEEKMTVRDSAKHRRRPGCSSIELKKMNIRP